MHNHQAAQFCRICGGPIHPCLNPFGAHLLCEPSAECRHEMCEVIWGDPDDDYQLPTCAHGERRRSA
jgi:hypothetical protein